MQKSDIVSLPVEVSGWDHECRFFVEYSTFDSCKPGQNTLLLRNVVRAHSVIFVRALYGNAFAKSYPRIHQVEAIEPAERCGFNKLHLKDFLPPNASGDEPKVPVEHPISVRDEVKR